MIDAGKWPFPEIFSVLQQGGNVVPEEMARTFNCGIGMAVIAEATEADGLARALEGAGERVFRIGTIEAGERGCTVNGSAGTWNSTRPWSATHQHG